MNINEKLPRELLVCANVLIKCLCIFRWWFFPKLMISQKKFDWNEFARIGVKLFTRIGMQPGIVQSHWFDNNLNIATRILRIKFSILASILIF